MTEPFKPNRLTISFAGISTLLLSSLPNILWQEILGPPNKWLLWSKIILLAVLIGITYFWQTVKPLRNFFWILLFLFALEESFGWIGQSHWFQTWFPESAGFTTSMLGVQLRRLAVAILMTLILFLIYQHPARFFLTFGNYEAPAAKEKFLIKENTYWSKLGWVLAICITGGTLTFLFLAGRPALGTLLATLPLLPVVLLFAAMNAFSEELNYRAALLAPLEPAVGKSHSILLTATFFGLGHFYGVPYGIIGVIMAFVLAYLLSKSMLETRGFFWPWFIHFLQDIAIFSFMAIGAILAGGG